MGKSLIKVALWATLIVTFCFKQSLAQTDSTVVPGAKGEDVVDATIMKIAQVEHLSQLLLPDDRLLLRIAWVETEFGTAQHTYSDNNYHGGIWRVDRDMFDLTQMMYNRHEFSEIFEAVSTVLGISWMQATWEDCRQPLYSGLAARLFLHNANPVIPPGWSVELQANYWRDHYPHDPPTGPVEYFTERVSGITECTKSFDLVFVIDGSWSVGSDDFNTSKTFVSDVVDSFEIGSDLTRVGVIQYSTRVNIEFHLNQYTNKSSLQQAIADISYLGGNTHTGEALGVMVDQSFQEENGSRGIGIPRVAVVVTDGRSNGPVEVRVPADRARDMGIYIFAIGVTTNIDEAELNAIANEPKETFVSEVSDFDAIPDIGAVLQDKACVQPAVLMLITSLNITIGQNQTQNFVQGVPPEGITIALRSTEGIAVLYGSLTVMNPNSAINDFTLTTEEGEGSAEIFIGPERFNRSSDGGGRRRRQVTNQNDTEANSGPIGTVYYSIEGKQPTNTFLLVTAEGDVTEPEATEPDTTEPDTINLATEPDTSTKPDTTNLATQPDTTKPDTTKPGNGGGTVTTTVPYIALMMLNGVIIARLAIAL